MTPFAPPLDAEVRPSMLAEFSWLFDPVWVLLAALLASWLQVQAFGAAAPATPVPDARAAAWALAALAPFVLRDARFGLAVAEGAWAALARGHLLRLSLLAGAGLLAAFLAGHLDRLPTPWLALWIASAVVLSSLARLALAAGLRALQRRGYWAEVVAVVGAGAVADRLLHELQSSAPQRVRLLGVFDDRCAAPRARRADGSVAQLIDLGKTQRIDWIVLTLPPAAEQRLQATVQRLKALSAPIGLCSPHVGLAPPLQMAGSTRGRRGGVPMDDAAPRWIATLAQLGLSALLAPWRLAAARRGEPPTYPFDDHDLERFTALAAGFGSRRHGYVVTPNADHLIRLHDDAAFRALYASADYVLLDSRFLSHLLHLTRRMRLPVCAGSDLTARLFEQVVGADDALVLVGGSTEQAQQLVRRYGARALAHHEPPMGFIHDPEAVEACLKFVEAHSPFRFCFLALGSPQQEVIAQALGARGRARGLTLCVGAAINFLTGTERRAPLWMQRAGMEWLYRLLQAPGRMAGRYLVRGPRVLALMLRARIVLRPAAQAAAPDSASRSVA